MLRFAGDVQRLACLLMERLNPSYAPKGLFEYPPYTDTRRRGTLFSRASDGDEELTFRQVRWILHIKLDIFVIFGTAELPVNPSIVGGIANLDKNGILPYLKDSGNQQLIGEQRDADGKDEENQNEDYDQYRSLLFVDSILLWLFLISRKLLHLVISVL